jgi:hypothetical protein
MIPSKLARVSLIAAWALFSSATAFAYPIITNVVETGGDNEATDTIVAKWTGVTYNTTVANEPVPATPVGTPFTVPLFGENAPCMVDRAHRWNSVSATVPMPSYLVGGEYIMIGNDNRDNANFRLDVYLSEPCLVYVLLDCRLTDGVNADPPESGLPLDQWTRCRWLYDQGFTPVLAGNNRAGDPGWPDEVGFDESSDGSINNYAAVFFKEVTTGSFYTGPYGQAQNMYGVVVKRQANSINNPPQITSVSPTNKLMFAQAAAGLHFSATTISPNSIATAGMKLLLNGTNVSSSLSISGTTTSRTAAYTALQPNTLYAARIVVNDQAGRATTNDFTFDTFATSSIAIEAEDYNHAGGQFLAAGGPGAYNGLSGIKDIDYHNQNAIPNDTTYRPGDFMGVAVTTDIARDAFTSTGAADLQVAPLLAGDWLNYTRNIPEGTYHVYLRASGAPGQLVALGTVTDPTHRNQGGSALGGFKLPAPDNGFAYTPLTDANGALVVLSLGGKTTLRASAVDANANLWLNYMLLVPTTGTQSPFFTSVSPLTGSTGVSPNSSIGAGINHLTKSIAQGSIRMIVDGNDVSSSVLGLSYENTVSLWYSPPTWLPWGSSHQVQVSFSDNDGGTYSTAWEFKVKTKVPTIPANYGTALGTGVGSGMNAKIRKAPDFNAGGTAFTLPNTSTRANAQLADTLIDPDTGAPYVNEAAGPLGNGRAAINVVNFSQAATPAAFFDGDEAFPHLDPATFSDPNNIAMEVTAYVELKAGIHRLGVRSDDGFRLTVGPTFDTSPVQLGAFEGGRGDALPGGMTDFDVNVEADGLYPLRLVYYEGNGGANIEFYSIDPITLERTLVNQPGADAALKAYKSRSVELHVPTVALTSPTAGQRYIPGPAAVTVSANASVVGGTITKVEFYQKDGYFQAFTKIGETITEPFSITLPSVGFGPHMFQAKATDNAGLTALSAPVEIRVGQSVNINFQQTLDIIPEGYLPDVGEVFGDRGNGHSYGWDLDNTANSRNRNNAASPDERFDTFNHFQKPQPAGSLWELEVPNGRYYVYAVCGESDNFDSTFDLTAEGTTIVSGTATTDMRWLEGGEIATVADGRLSLGNGPRASNNKITFVEIYALPTPAEPAALTISRSGSQITITWRNAGTLQSSPAVTGPWTPTGNSSGTYTETIEATRFFRVVR